MPSLQDIHTTAHAVFSILNASAIVACLVGSAAGSEHGISRTPNDVDILALAEPDTTSAVEIKSLLCSKDPRFRLEKPSSNPLAFYFILKYRLSDSQDCHVDIFLPGMIHLPGIPHNRVEYSLKTGLPVMPFFPVLLHKVQAWIAHRDSAKETARIKQANDVQDIRELLHLAVTVHKVKLEDQYYLPELFIQEAVQGVQQYVQEHPDTACNWEKVGFSHRPEQVSSNPFPLVDNQGQCHEMNEI